MATIIDYETTTAGNAVTTSEPNVDDVTGTVTAVADAGVKGANAAEASLAGVNYVAMIPADDGDIYLKAYIKFVSSLPSARSFVCAARNWNGSTMESIAEVQINTDGTLRIRNEQTLVDTSSTALVADTWYRIEWRVNRTGGTQELRIYTLHSGTITETLTGACNNSTATVVNRVHFGPTAAGGTGVLRFDETGYDATTWIGSSDTADTEDPVAVVSHTATDATFNSSDTMTSATFDVTAAASTDNVGVTGYSWSDNAAGGSFSSTTVAAPTWTPPDLTSGPWTLTCTVSDAAANSDAAGVVVDVPSTGGVASPVAGIAIAESGAAI